MMFSIKIRFGSARASQPSAASAAGRLRADGRFITGSVFGSSSVFSDLALDLAFRFVAFAANFEASPSSCSLADSPFALALALPFPFAFGCGVVVAFAFAFPLPFALGSLGAADAAAVGSSWIQTAAVQV